MHQQEPTPRGGERGASATEYALLVSGVAVMLVAIIVLFGDSLAGNWLRFAGLI